MKDSVFVDFETFSLIDLKLCGAFKYAMDSSTQALCAAYVSADGTARTWCPILSDNNDFLNIISYAIEHQQKIYGHGIFDLLIWNNVIRRDHQVPELPLSQYVDTLSLAATYTLPLQLKQIGIALNLNIQKQPQGTALINKLCKADKKGVLPNLYKLKDDIALLVDYCKQDVLSTREFVLKLPRQDFIPQERAIWELTHRMNEVGLPVDIESCLAIEEKCQEGAEYAKVLLPKLTNGIVKTPGQVNKIKQFCAQHGVNMPDLTADTVKEVLANPSLPEKVADVLTIRQYAGRSSTSKFKAFVNQYCEDGTIKGLLQYHGATTGRWTGRGVQLHNLPRAKTKDPEGEIKRIKSGQIKPEEIFPLAKCLIRPMIKAQADESLIVFDYSGIEQQLLAWGAQDPSVKLLENPEYDPYKDMASFYYNKPLADIKPEERQFGKVLVLGCGYGMSGNRLKETAVTYGLNVTKEEANAGVSAWRAKNAIIVTWWRAMQKAAMHAIKTSNLVSCTYYKFKTFTVNNIRWLAMQLPSGKSIYYMEPRIEKRKIPGYESSELRNTIVHSGSNPYTKKWDTLVLSPGRLVENAIQATAREVLAQGKINVYKRCDKSVIRCSVHDEVICSAKTVDAETEFHNIAFNLCAISWLTGTKLRVKGYITQRYRKD